MPTIRERVSDALLRIGTELALDRIAMTRSIASVPPVSPGYHSAMSALGMARRFDSAILWLSWRVRPRTVTRIR